uniref:Uncharacterized protein n=1 Tax=Arundo donax TaxID=35708 RepID=A0A0A9AJZ1_ARUDO
MVKCQITVDFSVKAPNLLILRCITPYYRVSLFKNLGSLVSASITVDDSFLRDDEYLHVDEEFLETSEDNADDGENRFVHAEGKNTVSESDHDDYSFDDDDLLDEFYDRHASNLVDNYDYGTDIDSDDNTYEYSEIAADYRVGQHDHRHDSRKQGGNCDEDSTNCTRTDDKAFSGQNVLHSLSNATSLELLAHSGENYGNKEAVKVGVKPKGRSFTCKHLATVKIRCSKDDVRVHKLAEFFNANGIPLENIYVHLSGSTYLHSMKEMREICRDELQESGDWWR